MRFQPSGLASRPLSSGYGDASVSVEVEGGKKPTSEQIGQYVDLGLSVIKGLFDEDDRTDAATVQAQIQIAEQKVRDNVFLPWPGYWKDRLTKLKAQLPAAMAMADEAAADARAAQWRNIGYTAAVFGVVAVIGGVAVNQVQRARRQQAEIEHLRASSGGVKG